MHSEETEIQIKLAEIQTDIQIYLTLTAGLLAATLAEGAIFFQIYPLLKEPIDIGILASVPLLVAVLVLCVYGTYHFARKTEAKRNELKKLKEKYTW